MLKYPMKLRIRRVRELYHIEKLARTAAGSWFIVDRRVVPAANISDAITEHTAVSELVVDLDPAPDVP